MIISRTIHSLFLTALLLNTINSYASECCFNPLITVITSLYKGDEFIAQFLEDMVRQTIFAECELIIINANSPGNEEPLIKEYAEEYPNIRYVRLAEDPGIYTVWNMAIKMSSAPFITNANVDDRLSITALAEHAKALLNNNDVDIVYSDLWYTLVPNVMFELDTTKVRLPINLQNILINCIGNHPMWRRTLHDRIGYFGDCYKSAGDWEMWLRAYDQGAVFMRIDSGHGVFYVNPRGLSTGRGAENAHRESREIKQQYEPISSQPRGASAVRNKRCCKLYEKK